MMIEIKGMYIIMDCLLTILTIIVVVQSLKAYDGTTDVQYLVMVLFEAKELF
jgi:hypothetical protein